MIVSQQWLRDYVQFAGSVEEWTERLTMTGLNLDGILPMDSDVAVHLEVTSNRPDCLGHIGVAREIGAAFDLPLTVPDPQPAVTGDDIHTMFAVEIAAPHLCSRFTARLIRGVAVGPSPRWLVERLQTIGVNSVNNIVDAANYVMFECGQPLHTFDFAHLRGGKIIVREPQPGETLVAIDHREYSLEPGMCLIADGQRPVGLGGVMGGADTEVSQQTVDVLVEAAQFNPVSIRNTARKLNLHSAASHRFERTVDGHQIDWAARRCCQLILEIAGGQLAAGAIDVGDLPPPAPDIQLRQKKLHSVLGIPVSLDLAQPILQRLGFEVTSEMDESVPDESLTVRPPSWRRDVTREIDLVEEVGRIHGYDRVPDDIPVPMSASRRRSADRVVERIRRYLTGAGLDEAMTPSLVPAAWADPFSPWTDAPALVSHQPILGVLEKSSQNIGQVNQLRRSLVPSLLEAHRINEYRSNDDVHLFEIARVYLANETGLPDEPTKLGIVSQMSFHDLKTRLEGLVQQLNRTQRTAFDTWEHELADANLAGRLVLNDQTLGYIGTISESGKRRFGFRQTVCFAELDVELLQAVAVEIPRHEEISPYPSIERDFNFVVDEQTRWAQLEATVRRLGGPLLADVQFKELFRDPDRDGPNKKRLLLTIALQSQQHTLTGSEADAVCQKIVQGCERELSATLLA